MCMSIGMYLHQTAHLSLILVIMSPIELDFIETCNMSS